MAVMLADVLLLNIFNSLGLPTSTTVSIVFDLLGASVCAAFYKIYVSDGSFTEIFNFINIPHRRRAGKSGNKNTKSFAHAKIGNRNN